MSEHDSRLFKLLEIGSLKLSSRIVMGPLSSNLANAETNILAPSAADYYGERACEPGTLIIGEATFISAQASGTSEARAGIWSKGQIEAWKAVVQRIHSAGSYIFLQLWALGRSADPKWKKRQGTGDVVSSSSVPEAGGAMPRALTEEEIWTYIHDYAKAATAAVEEAGFDGVEIHGANGSLVDQFTQDCANQRSDHWGGNVSNRNRFALKITKAVSEAVGPERVGFRVSPWSTYNSMGMSAEKTREQFLHLLEGLKELQVAYVHLVESRIAGRVDVEAGESLGPFIEIWSEDGSPFVLAGGFSPETARVAVDETHADRTVAIAFGRAFVTNPDLVRRLKDGVELK